MRRRAHCGTVLSPTIAPHGLRIQICLSTAATTQPLGQVRRARDTIAVRAH